MGFFFAQMQNYNIWRFESLYKAKAKAFALRSDSKNKNKKESLNKSRHADQQK